ncbi:hypothetical protein RMCBS344292_15031 [Rhizopus microsporus]|nr:hypothetical protein RMCBS344292_15031 [Rhizopus microsporus]
MFMATKLALVLGSLIGLVAAQSSCSSDTVSCHWSGSIPYGPNDEFTIHGFWPDNYDGTYVPFNGCDSSRILNNISSIIESTNGTLYSRMNTFWPSYRKDNNAFWSHEWNRHGICKALDLRDEHDVYGALSLSDVIPGNTYNVNTSVDAIQSRLGAQPMLNCDELGTLTDVAL